MTIARREFLGRLAGLVIASRLAVSRRWDTIGIQLYTVRDLMGREPDQTLAALAGIGYREVEMAGLYGRGAADLRGMLDKAGLRAPSGHVGLRVLRDDPGHALDDAATLGQRFIVCPFVDPPERTVDGYKRVAADLNHVGSLAKQRGLQLAYHNHDFEFVPVNGIVPYDLLLTECDAKLVQMEMDIFWTYKAGGDPFAYFGKYPGRYPMIHAKDMAPDGSMVDVGQGAIDFGRILADQAQAGLKHVFVEHDEPKAPLDDAEISYKFLSKLTY